MRRPEPVRNATRALSLQEQFGAIDIYIFDQILRGNIAPGMRIVDAGCGGGRNLVYLLRSGFEVFAFDTNPEAVLAVQQMARSLAPHLLAENFRVGSIEAAPFPDGFADVVLCNAVLHFARDVAHFRQEVAALWRMLAPGGLLFCRLGSRIGMDWAADAPNGWFLADAALLLELTAAMGAELVDPLKTTVVQDLRSMTTWVLRKP